MPISVDQNPLDVLLGKVSHNVVVDMHRKELRAKERDETNGHKGIHDPHQCDLHRHCHKCRERDVDKRKLARHRNAKEHELILPNLANTNYSATKTVDLPCERLYKNVYHGGRENQPIEDELIPNATVLDGESQQIWQVAKQAREGESLPLVSPGPRTPNLKRKLQKTTKTLTHTLTR